MYTRHLTLRLKRNAAPELTHVIETVIIPLLRKQKGFRDEVTFVAPDRLAAVSTSFWDTQEDAEAFNRAVYPEMLKSLTHVVEKNPRVETFEVAYSTFHQTAAKAY
jgi:heme-degrading monooxygenase HmoA